MAEANGLASLKAQDRLNACELGTAAQLFGSSHRNAGAWADSFSSTPVLAFEAYTPRSRR
jgi:hypothetical protein